MCEGAWSPLCGFYKCIKEEDEDTSKEVVVEIPREVSLEKSPSPLASEPDVPPRVMTSSPNKRARPSEDAAVSAFFVGLFACLLV